MTISRDGEENRRQGSDMRPDPEGPYDDIIMFPHHQSSTRKHMTMEERAAQFSPFAALTGYEAAIKETARQTASRLELSENCQEEIKWRLDHLAKHIHERPEVTITYFQPDQKKEGGVYVTTAGRIKRLDDTEGVLRMEDGTRIRIKDILKIQSSVLEMCE